jgi:hypothetical protein
MPLANYTTTVSATRTVYEIQAMLQAHGAKSIMIDYENGEPAGLAFLVLTKAGEIPFRLPANINRVKEVLSKMHTRRSWSPNADQLDRERASRVGWRILRDWVRAQLAIIETEMVTLHQVFLPYMETPDHRTLYEVMEGHQFLLKQGEESEKKEGR